MLGYEAVITRDYPVIFSTLYFFSEIMDKNELNIYNDDTHSKEQFDSNTNTALHYIRVLSKASLKTSIY